MNEKLFWRTWTNHERRKNKHDTQQTGSTPHNAYIATNTSRSASCAARVGYVRSTWVKALKHAPRAMAWYVQNISKCMATMITH
eukprot:725365-Karenia_brevis.AAC.1